MLKNIYRIDLDIKQKAPVQTGINFISADNQTSVLNIVIKDGKDLIDYSQVASAKIVFAKSDNTFVQGELVLDTDHYTYEMGTNAIASKGSLVCSVSLYGADDERLTASKFVCTVDVNPLSADAVNSSTEIDALAKAIMLLDKLEEDLANNLYKGEKGDAFVYSDFTAEQLASLKGADGDKGETGLAGSKGDKGDIGLTGDKGNTGEKGDTGATGAKGAKGDKGDTGSTGATGSGVNILGNYSTLAELQTAFPDGSTLNGGFMVGFEYYYWDTILNSWKSAGQIKGENGKTAYQSALDGGFTGTEIEFNKQISNKINPIDVADFNALKLLPLVVGSVYYITDNTWTYSRLWLDKATERVAIPVYKIITEAERLAMTVPLEEQFYYTSDKKELWRFSYLTEFEWIKITVNQLVDGCYESALSLINNPIFTTDTEFESINAIQGQTYITDTNKLHLDITTFYTYLYCPSLIRVQMGNCFVIETEVELDAIPTDSVNPRDYYYVKELKAFCRPDINGIWGELPQWWIFSDGVNYAGEHI